MTTIAERVRQIALSELADLRERYEDPERVVNQTIADAMVAYADLKKDAPSVLEVERQARERLESLNQEAVRWHRVARKALAAGNETDARTALSRRQDVLDRAAVQQGIYDQAHEVADAFRRRLAEVEDVINRLQSKLALIKAKEATTQATQTATSAGGASDVVRKLEDRADWELAGAEGEAEAHRAASADPFEELRQTQAATQAGADSSSVDEALRKLREQLEDED